MNKLWMGARIALCVGLGVLPGGTAFAQGSKIQVQWLGQSATKITTPTGKVIVIDPVAAAMVTPDFLKPKFAIPIHYDSATQGHARGIHQGIGHDLHQSDGHEPR
jgi:L-ascorbate metabolism protein UlaG (beta-lactamase superfamily)